MSRATRYSGVTGTLLEVDLTSSSWSTRSLDDQLYEQYLGGKSLAARLLWDEVPVGIDPLSAENVMVFTTGPLTGSGAPAGSRFNLSTKSVMTGGIATSNCGGDFGIYLKRAGFDALIVRGRSPEPCWLEIDELGVHFHDARHLWGLKVGDCQAQVSDKVGHVVIGPAGEHLVRYACIMSGERALGRGGVGAVMGSKHLKLITAAGAKRLRVHAPSLFKKRVRNWVSGLQKHSITGEQLPRYGTAAMVSGTNATNTLPTKNFKHGSYEHAAEISAEAMVEDHLVGNDGCSSCPIRCGRVVRHKARDIKGPEFETLGMLGSNIENRSLPHIIEWNALCDELGMDTISLGSTLATAMEMRERGVLSDLPVAFGSAEGISALIEDIACRRGEVAADLAEGSMRLAEKHGTPELAMQVKGLEFAAYEPRGAVGHGLGYAVSNRGGCHLNGGYMVYFEALGPLNMDPLTTKAKPALTVFQQNTFEAFSAAGGCIFPSYAVLPDLPGFIGNKHAIVARMGNKILQGARFVLGGQGKLSPEALPFHLPLIPHTKALAALMGVKMNLGLFTAVGERGYTLERLFNLREGMTAADDTLPPRMTDEAQRAERPDSRVPLDEMLPVYYKVRDWDEHGIPSDRLLSKLSMGFAKPMVDELRASQAAYRHRREELFAKEGDVLQRTLGELQPSSKLSEGEREAARRAFERARRVEEAAKIRRALFVIDPSRCRKCGICAEECPVDAITWRRGERALIKQEACIRCGRCFKVCPDHFAAVELRDIASASPPAPTEGDEAPQGLDDRQGLEFRVIDDKCGKCGICYKKCPVDAIRWQKKELAAIDPELCVACGHCFKVCPDKFDAIARLDQRQEA